MPTFVEEIQSVARGDTSELQRRLADRIETVGSAVGVLEEWTEASQETRTELSSKYDTAKSLARDEISDANPDENPEALSPEKLVSHPAVSEQTKRLLSEYSTKLLVFLDEERSYEGAREELRDALGAELSLYERLLSELGTGVASVRNAQAEIARLAREETLGPANVTAADVLLESAVEEESEQS
jgi:predicted  nucleic acid-binding Zn-ribbon protein